jgi:hypothetical protein
MNKAILNSLIDLRILVGYLGEQDQFKWWSSAFFSSNSDAFLSPVFEKTSFLAQYHGAREAAARVHDEHIGVGRVYHLFRLPEYTEQELHQLLYDRDIVDQARSKIKDKKTALCNLTNYYTESVEINEGPLKVGSIKEFNNSINIIAKMYYQAFENTLKVYPYFSSD